MLYESFGTTGKASGSKMLTNHGLRYEFGDFPFFPVFELFPARLQLFDAQALSFLWA